MWTEDDPSQSSPQPAPLIEVPREALSPEALQGLVAKFIEREGTDYGAHEVSHADKIQQVLRQIEKSEVVIVFDPQLQSVNLIARRDRLKLVAKDVFEAGLIFRGPASCQISTQAPR